MPCPGSRPQPAWPALATTALVLAGALRARRGRGSAGRAGRATAAAPAAARGITVVVAARDEIRALPALIRDLGRQDHREPDGRPAFDIVVVDDRSTDGSGRGRPAGGR